MHAADGAVRSAALHTFGFTTQIVRPIAIQGNPGMPALLGAPVNEAFFTDVQVPASNRGDDEQLSRDCAQWFTGLL